MLQSKEIKHLAAEVGFNLCGIARCLEMADDETFLQQWIKQGYHSSLSYMERNIDKRANVTKLVEGAKSVIVCALHYKNEFSEGYPADFNTKVASYATMRDYHDTIKQMLRTMCERLKEGTPELTGRKACYFICTITKSCIEAFFIDTGRYLYRKMTKLKLIILK